jgi:hypothetical protein
LVDNWPIANGWPGCAVAALGGGEEGLVAVSGSETELFSFSLGWLPLPRLSGPRFPGLRVSLGWSGGRLVAAGGYDLASMEPAAGVEALGPGGWEPAGRLEGGARTRQGELRVPGGLCTPANRTG